MIAAKATPAPSVDASAIDAKPSSSDFVASGSTLPRRPSSNEPMTVSGPDAEQQAGGEERLADGRVTRRGARPAHPLLEAVAEPLETRLDADRLTDEAAEEDRAEDVERARVAPRQREVDPDDRRHEPQPREHALLQPGRQTTAEQHPQRGPGEDRGDVDERARHPMREDGRVGGD